MENDPLRNIMITLDKQGYYWLRAANERGMAKLNAEGKRTLTKAGNLLLNAADAVDAAMTVLDTVWPRRGK